MITRATWRQELLGVELGLLAIWVATALVLSAIAERVRDWFALTDELAYERLAISIARSGSPLPRIHDTYIRSLDQLYPLLIAPFFRQGHVPHDLLAAHVAGAWIMSSACIPAFLLARRVTGNRSLAYLLGVLSICLPWLMYTPFLLTENAAYPAFLWALLALQNTATAPSRRNDILALLALALAFFARTEFLVLVAVAPTALLAHQVSLVPRGPVLERARAVFASAARAHPLITAVYVVLATASVALLSAGATPASVSLEGELLRGGLVPHGAARSFLGHFAQLSFGLGILPLVAGLAWLLANAVRGSASAELHAFACIGSLATLALLAAVTRYDVGLGAVAYDRYLFYLAPVMLLAVVCALFDRQALRWSLVIPAAIVAGGFVAQLQPSFTWTDPGNRVDSDTPVSIFYKPIADLWHSRAATSAVLVVATLGLTGLFALAGARVADRRRLAVCLIGLLAGLLTLETGYVFVRLLGVDGNSERPLTTNLGSTLDWVDKAVGTGARVTMVPYGVSSEYFVTLRYWRDLEFWNKSVDRDAEYPREGPWKFTGIWFPKLVLGIDPATGVVNASPTAYVVQSVTEARFRIAGTVQVQTPEAMLIAAPRPWRAAWMTFGLYDDGWTRPNGHSRVRIFSRAGASGAETLYLTLQIRAPAGVARRAFTVTSNAGQFRAGATDSSATFVNSLPVCVPAHGFAEVRLTTAGRSTIPGDLSTLEGSLGSRQGGLQVADISVSDDIGGPCHPAREIRRARTATRD